MLDDREINETRDSLFLHYLYFTNSKTYSLNSHCSQYLVCQLRLYSIVLKHKQKCHGSIDPDDEISMPILFQLLKQKHSHS